MKLCEPLSFVKPSSTQRAVGYGWVLGIKDTEELLLEFKALTEHYTRIELRGRLSIIDAYPEIVWLLTILGVSVLYVSTQTILELQPSQATTETRREPRSGEREP